MFTTNCNPERSQTKLTVYLSTARSKTSS